MMSEPLSISTNQSGCTASREVWNVWNECSKMEGFDSTVQNALEWKIRSLNSSRRSKRLFLHRLPTGFGVACIIDGSVSSRRKSEATMDLQRIQ